jgi:hypothetical protein
MSVLHHPIQNAILNSPLQGVLGSLPTSGNDLLLSSGGSFSAAYSDAFDVVSARLKEFSSAFSDAFTNDNI